MNRRCVNCGADFDSPLGRISTCPACARACRICGGKHKTLGLCGAHHQRWLRAGKPPLADYVRAVLAGEPIGRVQQVCRECGRRFVADNFTATCSTTCADARRRRRQRESKRDEWARRHDELIDRQRIRRSSPQGKARDKARGQKRWRETKADPDRLARSREQSRLYYAQRRQAAGLSYQTAEQRSAGKSFPPAPPPRQCAFCGRSLTGTRRRKYCSNQCRRWSGRPRSGEASLVTGLESAALAQAPPSRVYFATCAQCGQRFGSTSPSARFCSDDCRRASFAHRKRRGKSAIPAVCRICGSSFTGHRRNAACCSPACRAEAKRRAAAQSRLDPQFIERQRLRARLRNGTAARCIVCGRDMTAYEDLRANRYTCSAQCRAEAARRKNRRSYEKRRTHGNPDRSH